LLEALAKDFIASGYSVRHLLTTISRSSAYQLSARYEGEWKDSYTKYFARKFVRMLSAEELHDAIALATSRPGSFTAGSDKVGMSMQLSGPSGGGDIKYFMQTFGQSNRSNPPHPLTGSPLQPILLMQSPVVNDRVLAAKDSRVQRLLDTYKSDNGRVVDELFLATLSRPASRRKAGGARGHRKEPCGRSAESAMGAHQPGGVLLQPLRRRNEHENRRRSFSDPARSAQAGWTRFTRRIG